MPFAPGQSGNPSGRPPGSRNRRNPALEKFMDENAERIIEAAIARACAGDRVMLRVCMDRIVPRARPRPLAPRPLSASDALVAFGKIVHAVADGEITAIDGKRLARLVFATARRRPETDR